MDDKNCKDCYKIICRGCGWEPNDSELLQIQKGTLTTCPKCNWAPNQQI